RLDDVPLLLEELLQSTARARLVVDDEDACLVALAHQGFSTSKGNVTRKTVRPGRLSHVMSPPWSVTMRCEIARPSPVPLGFVEKNGSRMGASAVGIPGPSSSTPKNTSRGSRRRRSVT